MFHYVFNLLSVIKHIKFFNHKKLFNLNLYVSDIFYKYNKKIKILTFYLNFRTNIVPLKNN